MRSSSLIPSLLMIFLGSVILNELPLDDMWVTSIIFIFVGICPLVSRPGEFHPKSLSEPYVRLSTHTAPIIPASRALLCSRVHPFRLSHAQNRITQPLRSSPIARIHHYYELFRPCIPYRYSDPCGSSAWISPFAPEYRFPGCRVESWMDFP